MYGATVAKYFKAKAWIKARLGALENTASQRPAANNGGSGSTSSSQAALQKLRLPTFSGQQREWKTFKEKFTSLILNDESIAPVLKFQRLTDCLEEEAAEKLKGIKLSGANFLTAWETLCGRYDNQYLRFSVQMQALTTLQSSTRKTVKHLNHLLNTVNESRNTFRELNRPVDQWDDFFVYFVESKLAASTRLDWAKEVERKSLKDFPKFADIKKFLEDRIRTLDLVESESGNSSSCRESSRPSNSSAAPPIGKEPKLSNFQKRAKSTSVHVAGRQRRKDKPPPKCSYCAGGHFIGYCEKFAALPEDKKQAHVKLTQLCFNCLQANHMAENCESKGRCFVCNKRHHTKLHPTGQLEVATSGSSTTQATPIAQATMQNVVLCATRTTSTVLLSTAYVILRGPYGEEMRARALLESGAEESFITEEAVQILHLRRTPIDVSITGVGGTVTAKSRKPVTFQLRSANEPGFCLEVAALTLPKLTAMLPRAHVVQRDWPHLTDLNLADPYFGTPTKIDCILGARVYATVQSELRAGAPGTPVAFKSIFGWVLMGEGDQDRGEAASKTLAHCTLLKHDIDQQHSSFWELEEVPASTRLSPDEKNCYSHFRETHSRDVHGRFTVRLPFAKRPELTGTQAIANACLKRLDGRLRRDPVLQQGYQEFMESYH